MVLIHSHKERTYSKVEHRNKRLGLLFISPWLIGFACFGLYPVITSFYYSLCSYSILKSPVFTGVENYKYLFTQDPLFWKSLYNTLYYAGFSISLGTLISITAALLLNMKVRGMAIYRTIYYLPVILPLVASSIIWMWLLNPQYGILNYFLYVLRLPTPGWIADSKWSKPALIIMSFWGLGSVVLIYLAGLSDIPTQLYEVAELDGASWWHKVFYITIPMLTPVIFFNLVMGTIGSFQYFTQAYVMTRGGPADSTLFYSLYLFFNAFRYYKMGYASAMAWILFLIVLGVTFLIFKSARRWVYYRGIIK